MAYRSVSQVPVTEPEQEFPAGRTVNPQWNQTAERIGTAFGRTVREVRAVPQRARQLQGEVRGRFETIRGGRQQQGADLAERLREKAEQTKNELRGRAEENLQVARNRAERLVRERPIEIIAATFGAAFLFGVGLRIWRSNHA